MGLGKYILVLVVYVFIDYLILMGTHTNNDWYYSPFFTYLYHGAFGYANHPSLADVVFRKETLSQAIPLSLAYGIVVFPFEALVILCLLAIANRII